MNFFNKPFQIRNYGTKEDTFTLLIKKYKNGVRDIILNNLQTDKKMTEDNANDFVDKLLNLDQPICHNIIK